MQGNCIESLLCNNLDPDDIGKCRDIPVVCSDDEYASTISSCTTCLDYYAKDINGKCLPCNYKCKVCTDITFECTICAEDRINPPDCICFSAINNLIDDGINSKCIVKNPYSIPNIIKYLPLAKTILAPPCTPTNNLN